MEPVKVFLSSTYRESQWRETAIETIRSLPGFEPVLIEETAAVGATVQEVIFQQILDSDVMVLILGASLGSQTAESKAFHLEVEYLAAKKVGKPVIVMMLGDRTISDIATNERTSQPDFPRLMELRRELSASNIIGVFDTREELRQKLQTALLSLAQDRLEPTFSITFDTDLSEQQIRTSFAALSDYYRACGGIGLSVEFEREQVEVGDLLHV